LIAIDVWETTYFVTAGDGKDIDYVFSLVVKETKDCGIFEEYLKCI